MKDEKTDFQEKGERYKISGVLTMEPQKNNQNCRPGRCPTQAGPSEPPRGYYGPAGTERARPEETASCSAAPRRHRPSLAAGALDRAGPREPGS